MSNKEIPYKIYLEVHFFPGYEVFHMEKTLDRTG